MNSIPTRDAPSIQRILVDEGVSTLEIGRVFQESIVLIFDIRPRNLLLNDILSPIIVEPRLGNLLGRGVREQKGIVQPCHVQVNLDMWA